METTRIIVLFSHIAAEFIALVVGIIPFVAKKRGNCITLPVRFFTTL